MKIMSSYPYGFTEFNVNCSSQHLMDWMAVELWKTDGTGAELVKDINNVEDGSYFIILEMNDELYFYAARFRLWF